jgi:hypothetical protein
MSQVYVLLAWEEFHFVPGKQPFYGIIKMSRRDASRAGNVLTFNQHGGLTREEGESDAFCR